MEQGAINALREQEFDFAEDHMRVWRPHDDGRDDRARACHQLGKSQPRAHPVIPRLRGASPNGTAHQQDRADRRYIRVTPPSRSCWKASARRSPPSGQPTGFLAIPISSSMAA
jgi:hypothetical protein